MDSLTDVWLEGCRAFLGLVFDGVYRVCLPFVLKEQVYVIRWFGLQYGNMYLGVDLLTDV